LGNIQNRSPILFKIGFREFNKTHKDDSYVSESSLLALLKLEKPFRIIYKQSFLMKGGEICMYKKIIEPRVSETDGVGHINNTTIPIWFEAARNEIFKLFTPDSSFENWKMIILNMNVDYMKQIYFGKDVEVFTWVQKIGNSSLQLYEEIHQEGRVCAKGTVTYVNFNLKKQQSETIPQEIRKVLELHLYQTNK
jgi:acyl-CoA thioester hydrolase